MTGLVHGMSTLLLELSRGKVMFVNVNSCLMAGLFSCKRRLTSMPDL